MQYIDWFIEKKYIYIYNFFKYFLEPLEPIEEPGHIALNITDISEKPSTSNESHDISSELIPGTSKDAINFLLAPVRIICVLPSPISSVSLALVHIVELLRALLKKVSNV